MSKRETHLDRAIRNIDEKIRALQLAKEHLEEERETKKQSTKRRTSARATTAVTE